MKRTSWLAIPMTRVRYSRQSRGQSKSEKISLNSRPEIRSRGLPVASDTDPVLPFRPSMQLQPFLGSATQPSFGGAPAFYSPAMTGQQYGDFGQSAKQRGSCFACGSFTHWRNQFPFITRPSATKSKAE